jgi:hypothetical protein
LARSTARAQSARHRAKSRQEERRGAPFDSRRRLGLELIDVQVEFSDDGGHADLVAHKG